MPRVALSLIMLEILFAGSPSMAAGLRTGGRPLEIAIVVNKANPIKSLTVEEVRRLFLRQRLKWSDGRSVSVAQLSSKDPLVEVFRDKVLRMSPGQLKEYWRNLKLTRGLSAPRCYGSRRLLAYVLRKTRGGVGILERKDVGKTLKVVAVFKVPRDDGK